MAGGFLREAAFFVDSMVFSWDNISEEISFFRGRIMMKKIVFLLVLMLFLAVLPGYADGPDVTFSLSSGFYRSPQMLEITCNNRKAAIYYTLDGTIPNENSLRYEGPISLGSSNERPDVLTQITDISGNEPFLPSVDFPTGHVVRAVAITANGQKSAVVSGTFFVGYDRKKLYGDTAIMFLVTDPDGLFNYDTGIYAAGRHFAEWKAAQTEPWEAWQAQGNFSQRGDAWERPVSVTFLPAKGEGFTQEMGMRIKGGASRSNAQKSMRLIARKEYGEKNVDYVLYPDNLREADGDVVDEYKSFTLRNGGNDCDFSRIRDPFIARLAEGMRFETAQNMPCIAFINGEFWGMYTLNEEYTDKYIQYHYDIDDNNVIIVKLNELDEGEESDMALYCEMMDFILNADLSDPAQYEKAAAMVDTGSFADYFALHFYIGNEDGPFQNNNWQLWRVRRPDSSHPHADGRWRMMLYDTDYSSGIYVDGTSGGDDFITPVLAGTDYAGYHPALLFQSLMQSPDFRREFILACCDVQNIYFTSKRVKDTMEEMNKAYKAYIPDTWRRFGPAWVLWDPEDHFKNEISQTQKFFMTRASSFIDTLKGPLELGNAIRITIKVKGKGEVFINGRDVPVPHNTKVSYFPLTGMTVTAVPAKGATFKGWKVSHESAVVADPSALTTHVDFTRVFTLTAQFD